MRRGGDDAVGGIGVDTVILQNGERHQRGRRIDTFGRDTHFNTVGGTDPHCRHLRGGRERVGVDTQIQRPRIPHLFAIFADRLGNRHDMVFVETSLQRTAAMPRSSEGDAFCLIAWIGFELVVVAYEHWDVDQLFSGHRFAGHGIDHDGFSSFVAFSVSTDWELLRNAPACFLCSMIQ